MISGIQDALWQNIHFFFTNKNSLQHRAGFFWPDLQKITNFQSRNICAFDLIIIWSFQFSPMVVRKSDEIKFCKQ